MDIQRGEASTSQVEPSRHDQIFKEFENYPFNDDSEFKAGLPTVISAIRDKKLNPSSIDELLSKAQWFFFTRKMRIDIPWEAYAAYSRSQYGHVNAATMNQLNVLTEAKSMMQTLGDGQHGLSFDMLCRLIHEGRADEVPRVEVPEGLNPSISALPTRLKPWEMQPSLMTEPASDHVEVYSSDMLVLPSGSLDQDAWYGSRPGILPGEVELQDFGQMSEEDMALVFGNGLGSRDTFGGGTRIRYR
ncbi:hypothetical protein L204_105088 [Cryptococcus depauperatus]